MEAKQPKGGAKGRRGVWPPQFHLAGREVEQPVWHWHLNFIWRHSPFGVQTNFNGRWPGHSSRGSSRDTRLSRLMSKKWLQAWEPSFSKSSFILSRYGCHVFFIQSIDVPLSCISFTNSWHQTLAGSCFQYLCISPPTAGSNLQKTVHELRYALACSNVVVG